MKTWYDRNDMLFVRVTITNDEIDEGRLIVIFSEPYQPEFFAINYLEHEINILDESDQDQGFKFTVP